MSHFQTFKRRITQTEAVHVTCAEDVDLLLAECAGKLAHSAVERHKGCDVFTREGPRYHMQYPFWLARDVNGDVYPIADDVFERTFIVPQPDKGAGK